ncbi:MAG: cation ABC transporter substrate-binding protein [candidate division Zixibacteria bacterium]|nr:cation ABC transporter substrate-binding protein [candidate division Zixibacteria bacterium]
MRTVISALVLLVFLSQAAFPADEEVTKLDVMVSITPQKYFLNQIASEFVNIHLMIPPGANPATYEPKPSQMEAINDMKAYFAIGVPFDIAWAGKIGRTNVNMPVVFTDHKVEKMSISDETIVKTVMGGKDLDPTLDPHIWLSPRLVKKQMENYLRAMKIIYNSQQELFTQRYQEFLKELHELDVEIKLMFKESGLSRRFMTYHPSWSYFARDYDLIQVAIEQNGKEPSPARMKELIDYAKEHDINTIFVEPQFSTKKAEAIAEAIGAKIVVLDPLAENWKDNLLSVATKIKESMK